MKNKQFPTRAEIQKWIISYLALVLEVDLDEIDINIPFERYGLDSSVAIGMSGELEEWLGSKFGPTLLYDYPTIKALVDYISQEHCEIDISPVERTTFS